MKIKTFIPEQLQILICLVHNKSKERFKWRLEQKKSFPNKLVKDQQI